MRQNSDNLQDQAYITDWGKQISQIMKRVSQEIREGGERVVEPITKV